MISINCNSLFGLLINRHPDSYYRLSVSDSYFDTQGINEDYLKVVNSAFIFCSFCCISLPEDQVVWSKLCPYMGGRGTGLPDSSSSS